MASPLIIRVRSSTVNLSVYPSRWTQFTARSRRILGQPMRIDRDINQAVLDYAGLRVDALCFGLLLGVGD
jgi:hypothetical protein